MKIKRNQQLKKVKAPVVPVSNTTSPSMGNVFSADSESGKDLIADFAEMIFYDDGNTIRSFHSTGDCTFILHTFDKQISQRKQDHQRTIFRRKF